MAWIFVVFVVLSIAISLYRFRRGGPGPVVNWVPRSLRPRINGLYAKRGWQRPYDDDGKRNPDRDII